MKWISPSKLWIWNIFRIHLVYLHQMHINIYFIVLQVLRKIYSSYQTFSLSGLEQTQFRLAGCESNKHKQLISLHWHDHNHQLLHLYLHKHVLVQACLRVPHVVADEAKLAIVFTYFFLLFSFSSFSSPPSTFHPLRGISRAWKFVSPNILA